jgi:hypothetical protein
MISALSITACDRGGEPPPADPSEPPVATAEPTDPVVANEIAGLPRSDVYALRVSDRLYFVGRSAVPELLAEALAGKVRVDRVEGGWRVLSIERDALVEGLGLRTGDVIRTVDGVPLPSADALVSLVRALPERDAMTVGIDRDGATIELRYSIRDSDAITRSECIEQLVALVRTGVDVTGDRVVVDRAVLEELANVELLDALHVRDRDALLQALGLDTDVASVDGLSLAGPNEVLGALGRHASASSFVVELRTDFGTRPRTIEVGTGRVAPADLVAVLARLAAVKTTIASRPTPLPDPLARPPEGAPEAVPLDGAAVGIVAIDETHYTIPKALRDELGADPSVILKSARVVPATRDGKTIGFKLYGIRRGGAFSFKWLGLKNGDTVVAVSGVELRAMEDLLDGLPKWKKAKKLVVEIERKGKPLELVWTFE